MMKYIKSLSLRSMLIVLLVFSAIVPLLFFTYIALNIFQSSANEESYKKALEAKTRISEQIEDYDNYLDEQLSYLKNQRRFLFSIKSQDKTLFLDEIESYLNKTSTKRFIVYDSFGSFVFWAVHDGQNVKSPNIESSIRLKPDLIETILEKEKHITLDVRKGEVLEVIQYSLIKEDNKNLGIIEQVIAMSPNDIRSIIADGEVSLSILDENSNVRFSMLENLKDYPNDYFKEKTSKRFRLYYSENEYSVFIMDSFYGLTPMLSVSQEKYLKREKNILLSFIIVLVVLFVLIIPILYFASSILIRPIKNLTSATRAMKEGSPIQLNQSEWNNELGVLNENFKDMADKLNSAQTSLKSKLAELQLANKKIQQAQAQLVQNAKMAGLGQLVAGVAHELNNPIGFIQSNIEYLEGTVQDLSRLIEKEDLKQIQDWKKEEDWNYVKEDLQKLMRACRDGANRAARIVKDLKSFSRQDKGEKTQVHIEDLVENSLRLLANYITENIKIKTHYQIEKPLVSCNANQINQVIMNILTNAIHALNGSGNIAITTETRGDNFVLIIEDDGRGIKEEDLEHIFEPFFTTKEIGKGTGLGLSISHSLIDEHDGEIQVSSKAGQGTRITILLPLK